jgi:hypothetical protein
VAPPVFKTGLAANIVAGGFDSLPPPPAAFCSAGRKEMGTLALSCRLNGSPQTVTLFPLKLVKVKPV